MKIITVNLPVPYIKTIELLVGNDSLYPSRSELIRVAIRDFLIKELEVAKTLPEPVEEPLIKPVEKPNEVKIPIGFGTYKTYKVIQK